MYLLIKVKVRKCCADLNLMVQFEFTPVALQVCMQFRNVSTLHENENKKHVEALFTRISLHRRFGKNVRESAKC